MPSLTPDERAHRRQRRLILIAATLGGIAVGVLGDVFASQGGVSPSEVVTSLLLSPVAVTFGGKAVSAGSLSVLFLIGGLFFWPVYGFCAWKWLHRGQAWTAVVIFVWTAQGFFQVVSRMQMLMSA